jgi:hypothetical protein
LDGDGLGAILEAKKVGNDDAVRPKREIQAEVGVVPDDGEIVRADKAEAGHKNLAVRLDGDGRAQVITTDMRR